MGVGVAVGVGADWRANADTRMNASGQADAGENTGQAGLVGTYRRLPWHADDASEMLASAEALLEGVATTGRPALRWYVPRERSLILGASQKLRAVDEAACRGLGVPVYQRAAGGAAVLVDEGMLGLDVALPRDHPLLCSDLTASYRWLGEAWTGALRAIGLPAALVGVEQARASVRDARDEAALARLACYGTLSPYEVTLEGRKVVGLAQVRRRHGALFQVGVLLRWRPERLAALLALSPVQRPALAAALVRRVAGLEDVAGYPISHDALIAAFERSLAARRLVPVAAAWDADELATVERLRRERYRPLIPGAQRGVSGTHVARRRRQLRKTQQKETA